MSNNSNDSQRGGNFFNGFLLGALIGGGVVFLLGTKKGKQLFKTITEGGFEGISEIEDLIEDIEEEHEIQSEEPLPQANGHTANGHANNHSQVVHHAPSEGEVSAISKLKSTGRRFFKRVPKV